MIGLESRRFDLRPVLSDRFGLSTGAKNMWRIPLCVCTGRQRTELAQVYLELVIHKANLTEAQLVFADFKVLVRQLDKWHAVVDRDISPFFGKSKDGEDAVMWALTLRIAGCIKPVHQTWLFFLRTFCLSWPVATHVGH